MVVTGPWPGIVVMSDTGRCVAVPQWPGAGCHYPHKIFTIHNISAANIPSLYKVKIVLGKQVRITIQYSGPDTGHEIWVGPSAADD